MAKICILATTNDAASMNMYDCLISQANKTSLVFDDYPLYSFGWGSNDVYLAKSDRRSVEANHIDVDLKNVIGDLDVLIFLSKHASASGIPTFCLHTQGNWNKADLGGSPQTLGMTPVVLKNALYREMVTQNQTEFDVVHEGTHHGPDLNIPCIFYEIGSTEKEWGVKAYGEFMVSVLKKVVSNYAGEKTNAKTILGIGGSHTCTNFNRLSAENHVLIGHVVPNYAVMSVTSDMILQAVKKTTRDSQIVVDWKALNSEMRKHITAVLSAANVDWIKLKELKKQADEQQSI